MTRRRTTGGLIVAATFVVLMSSACTTSHRPNVASDVAATSSPSPASTSPAPTAPPSAAPAPVCIPAQLKASFTGGTAAGENYFTVTLTNVGLRPCQLRNQPKTLYGVDAAGERHFLVTNEISQADSEGFLGHADPVAAVGGAILVVVVTSGHCNSPSENAPSYSRLALKLAPPNAFVPVTLGNSALPNLPTGCPLSLSPFAGRPATP